MASQSFNQNFVTNGLTSNTVAVPYAGTYNVSGKLTLPSLVSGGGASAVVVTVTQNSTTVYTGLAGAQGYFTEVLCAAGDTITVALTSTSTADNAATVKCTINITQGVS